MTERPVTEAADRYLDRFHHTESAYRHVGQVLMKYEYMVELATKRALDLLEVDALIYAFPVQRPADSFIPDGAA